MPNIVVKTRNEVEQEIMERGRAAFERIKARSPQFYHGSSSERMAEALFEGLRKEGYSLNQIKKRGIYVRRFAREAA